MKRDVSIIVFWGAVWGLFEATAGYILHELAIGIGWMVYFPGAYYFMSRVYRQSKKPGAILYTSFIAAAIKLVNFLLPVRIDRVINPAASIILEGLAVFAIFKMLEVNKESILRFGYPRALAVSLAWRVLYITYLLPLPAFIVEISALRGIIPLLNFLLIEGFANSAVIYAGMLAYKRAGEIMKEGEVKSRIPKEFFHKASEYIRMHPVYSFILLFAAIFVQWAL